MSSSRVLIIFISCLWALTAFSQQGSIAGRITDKEANDEPLPFATVVVKGTSTGTVTNMDGSFQIPNLAPGDYTLRVTFIGYEDLEIPQVVVEPNKVTEITTSMGAGSVQLDEVVVTAKAITESETALLMVQKKSIEIKQSIGAQELSRKGLGDAESAVTNVTGVSKQAGSKNVVVRGLDDRYNATSYNGLPLPSEDPEYKNINLSFFSSDIIDNIEVNKTFSNSLYGNVGGADINIVAKQLNTDQSLEVTTSGGYNSIASTKNFVRIDGTNKLGWTKVNTNPISDLTEYDFVNSFDPTEEGKPLNFSLGIRGGKIIELGGKELRTYVVASTASDFVYREGLNRSNPTGTGLIGRDLSGSRSIQNSNQTFMVNLGYDITRNIELAYNHLLIHSNSQNFSEYSGFAENISEVDGTTAFIRRQQVNDNTLLVNQLHLNANLSERMRLKMSLGYNTVWGNEPDRRTNTFQIQDATNTYVVASGSAGANHRFFSELKENDLVGKAVVEYNLTTNVDNPNKLKIGYNYRNTSRDFEYRQFAFATPGARTTADINNLDGTFNQTNISNGTFNIQTNRGSANFSKALNPELYEGDRSINAPFVNLTYGIGDKLILDGGVRVEMVNQKVFWNFSQSQPQFPGDTRTTTTLEKTFVLPSINARYELNEDNILRLSASQTYILPQFKEVSPFLYENIAFRSFGNKDLRATNIYNLDLKYDRYFSRSELISVGVFYKYIELPINRSQVNSAGSDLSYVNTPDAFAYGAEVEFRKTLVNFSESSYLNIGASISYLFSQQTLEDVDFDEITSRFYNETSALQGASPLIAVGDITYNLEKDNLVFSSALLFSTFQDRINAIGNRTDNILGQSYPTLDWVNRVTLNERVNLNLSVKNILNPVVEETVSDIVLTRYQNGTVFSVGFGYKFL